MPPTALWSSMHIIADVGCIIGIVTGHVARLPSVFFLHAPDFAFHNHAVRFNWLCGRASQYRAAAHVELTSVPWTRHGRSIEGAFVQRTSPMCAFSLRGTETARDIEHRRVTDQQARTSWHRVDAKLVIFEDR